MIRSETGTTVIGGGPPSLTNVVTAAKIDAFDGQLAEDLDARVAASGRRAPGSGRPR